VAKQRPTVLIVEDDDRLRELVRASLGSGYRYLEAASVDDAVAALSAETPDLVVLDLMLIGGSGLEVLETIRRLPGPPIPVVVVSAWATAEYRDAAARGGADAFIAKPFLPEELAEAAASLLATR
jgi:CheY-like chemotaxis protein